jgi:hypothetical protein
MATEQFFEKVKAAFKARQYEVKRGCHSGPVVVSKFFNLGHGLLELYVLDDEEKRVLSNSCLERKPDMGRLAKVSGGFMEERVDYGYPEYYKRDFVSRFLHCGEYRK